MPGRRERAVAARAAAADPATVRIVDDRVVGLDVREDLREQKLHIGSVERVVLGVRLSGSPGSTKTPTVTGISPAWMRLSSTMPARKIPSGSRHRCPSWKTSSEAGADAV